MSRYSVIYRLGGPRIEESDIVIYSLDDKFLATLQLEEVDMDEDIAAAEAFTSWCSTNGYSVDDVEWFWGWELS